MKIYTRTGDDGTTSLVGGARIPKCDIRVEAYGSVDELISWIGVLRDSAVNEKRNGILIYIQDQLMIAAAMLATDPKEKKRTKISPDKNCIRKLENEIDRMEKRLKPLDGFILPGGDIQVSFCHIARCVCRRAERAIARLTTRDEVPEKVVRLLNRLSDYLFVLSRVMSLELDNEEVRWPL
jgi:cob(I)alamin adenosyltransferase